MTNHSGFYWSKRWWGGSGISWTICKLFAPCSRQITTLVLHHSSFYRPDALPAAQPTASEHWRQLLQKNSYFAGRCNSIASSNGGACTMLKMLFQAQSIICRLFLYVRCWCVQVRCHDVSSTRKTGWNVRLCCPEESGGSPHSLGAGKPAGWWACLVVSLFFLLWNHCSNQLMLMT